MHELYRKVKITDEICRQLQQLIPECFLHLQPTYVSLPSLGRSCSRENGKGPWEEVAVAQMGLWDGLREVIWGRGSRGWVAVGNKGTVMAVGGDCLRGSSVFQGFSKLWSHQYPQWVLLFSPPHPSPVPCPIPPHQPGKGICVLLLGFGLQWDTVPHTQSLMVQTARNMTWADASKPLGMAVR